MVICKTYSTIGMFTTDLKSRYDIYIDAAKRGDANAQVEIGICYYDGYEVEQSYIKAFKWFLQAAEQGDAVALYRCSSNFDISYNPPFD